MSETLSLAFAFAWLFAIPSAHSQEVAPDVLVKSLSSEVIAEIRRDRAIQAGDGAKIAALIETKIVPHFDLRRITQLAVGQGWRRATPEQQERLMQEFKTLLVRTYSGALASYRDQEIEFRPLRAAAGDTEVTVKSLIRQKGAEPIEVVFDRDRRAMEDLRRQARRHQPRRDLPQQLRRGSAQQRRRRADRPAREKKPTGLGARISCQAAQEGVRAAPVRICEFAAS